MTPTYTVLTYIIGDYEKLHEVAVKSPHARYLCITDREDLKSDTWELIVDTTLTGSPLNKTRYIKWHPWHYAATDIVMMIDGSIAVTDNLDDIIQEFDGYQLSLMIHPERNTVRAEMDAWMQWRGLNPDDAYRQLAIMELIDYPLNSYRGLYQCCYRLLRRTPGVQQYLETVTGLLKLCGKHGEYATPEQVLASFTLNRFFNRLPVLWVSEHLIASKYLTWYHHGTDTPLVHQNLIEPYAFNRPVQVWM